jgi:predicted permease
VGVAHAERLVDIGVGRSDGGFNPASFPTYLEVRDRARSLDGVYAQQMFPQALSLAIGGVAEAPVPVFGLFVTRNYFAVLGVPSAAGRLFGPADSEEVGASRVVVLSHRFWTRRFGGDATAVGSVIRLNGQPFTVVGIAGEGFHGTGVTAPEVWVSLSMFAAVNGQRETIYTNRESGWLVMGARLRPGLSLAAATADVESLGQDLEREHPSVSGAKGLRVLASSSVPGNRAMVAVFAALLMGLVMLVLLVACANVSGLLLARGVARRREIAVRLAIGAGRARLVRQLLTETIALFLFGGLAGLAVAKGLDLLLVNGLAALPFPVNLSPTLDAGVLAFTTGLSLLAAVVSGLTPALETTKANPVTALKDESHGSARSRLRHAFVIAQVALSVTLVVEARLFVRALDRAGAADPGFDSRGVELTALDLSMAGYSATPGLMFWRDLLDRARTLPGVQEATLARVLPGGFEGIGLGLGVPGSGGTTEDEFEPDGNIVAAGYFRTLRIPLIAGRDFDAGDRAGTLPVAIVGEGAARHFWPGQNAIGKHLSQQVEGVTRAYVVVGIVRDIKSTSLVDGLSQSFVYLPLEQQYASPLATSMTIVVRTRKDTTAANAIRQLVASMNPNLPLATTQTLDESIALGLVPQRVAAALSGSLGVVGVLLAAIGIYGVTAFLVTRRLHEFGIRAALGARRGEIVRIVLQQGVRLTLFGCALGVPLAAGASQVLTPFLFGAPALDAGLLAGTVGMFALVGLGASFEPAYRATRLDPVALLRRD